jgi:hypothetical protein
LESPRVQLQVGAVIGHGPDQCARLAAVAWLLQVLAAERPIAKARNLRAPRRRRGFEVRLLLARGLSPSLAVLVAQTRASRSYRAELRAARRRAKGREGRRERRMTRAGRGPIALSARRRGCSAASERLPMEASFMNGVHGTHLQSAPSFPQGDFGPLSTNFRVARDSGTIADEELSWLAGFCRR